MFRCLLTLALLSLGAPPALAQSDALRPNILLVMTDDQGWGDVYSHGNAKIDTPVLDRLATEGARFDRFYVSPVCAPTRAALLTGRYALRTGTAGVTRGLEAMRAEEVTLAEVFRDAGYATGLFGKWHNGSHYPQDPNGQGFDTFVGFAAGHWNNYVDTHLTRNQERIETQGYITDALTDAAIAFITAHRDQPFLAYVPYNAPHSPFQVPDAYFDRYKARGLDDVTASAYAMVENIDDNLGRLLATLDALGLRENTIVLFLTDNGPNGDRFNGGMRGRKGSVHEGGVRVPLFIRWPGHIPQGRLVRELAAHIDLLPTLADLAGVSLPDAPVLDGVSLAPLLAEEPPGRWLNRSIFSRWSRPEPAVRPYPGAVRTDRWRAVHTGDGWALFDMLLDPAQTTDVAAEHPGVTTDLAAAYDAWFTDVTQTPIERMPIPVGYPEVPVVTLPAPEAYFDAPIRYFEGNGWANDWLTGWTEVDATIAWDLAVAAPGRFAVTLLYTAPDDAVGAQLRVEAHGRQVAGTIRETYDPAPLPSPDRVPRKEVYEKVWGELALGTLQLDAGRTRLTLRAERLPGPVDVKAVRLRRVE